MPSKDVIDYVWRKGNRRLGCDDLATGLTVKGFLRGFSAHHTPVNIGETGVRAIVAGFTKYTASEGILELREAVAEKLRADSGLEYEAGQVVISNVAKHSLCNAMMCLFGEGDEVIIPGACADRCSPFRCEQKLAYYCRPTTYKIFEP